MVANMPASLTRIARTPFWPTLLGILSAAGWGSGIVVSRAALEAGLDVFSPLPTMACFQAVPAEDEGLIGSGATSEPGLRPQKTPGAIASGV